MSTEKHSVILGLSLWKTATWWQTHNTEFVGFTTFHVLSCLIFVTVHNISSFTSFKRFYHIWAFDLFRVQTHSLCFTKLDDIQFFCVLLCFIIQVLMFATMFCAFHMLYGMNWTKHWSGCLGPARSRQCQRYHLLELPRETVRDAAEEVGSLVHASKMADSIGFIVLAILCLS